MLMVIAQAVWRWEFAWEIVPQMLAGLQTTILATLGGIVLAMILGLVLAIARRSERRWVRLPVGGVIEFIRSTPLLVQLYFVFFLLPLLHPALAFSAFTTGVTVLGIHYATYTSEVYRAGIDAVPRGQWEAATALNFRRGYTWRRIVLPQSIPPVIPALGNYLISMFKDTPQLLVIGVAEVLRTGRAIGDETFRYVEPLTTAGVFFIVLSYASALLVRRVERRYGSAVEMPIGGI